jgi:hypothetical protein
MDMNSFAQIKPLCRVRDTLTQFSVTGRFMRQRQMCIEQVFFFVLSVPKTLGKDPLH